MNHKSAHYDFIVVGSGFAGSITAMALANSNFKVCLIEKGEHPRFAIGESSTPIADMVLRDLSERYSLPFLQEISRYGEWQKRHPEVICGLKRGFSYYPHKKGERFKSDKNHSHELLVAASIDSENSDTNWLRSDVDHFLIQNVLNSPVSYLDNTEINRLERVDSIWEVQAVHKDSATNITSDWIIDATGSPQFSGKFFGTKSSSKGFHTNSMALFSHLKNAGTWSDYLKEHNFYTGDYPYNPDDSALHHLIEEGWVWMLRFNNDLLSTGVLIDLNTHEVIGSENPKNEWLKILKSYPSLSILFVGSEIPDSPGRVIRTKRLQRRLNKTFGEGWVALPHTSGFVDPLHSTGIAHTLTGVEKIVHLFVNETDSTKRLKRLEKIETNYFKELSIIDLMVSTCYKSKCHFDIFTASVMLYFVASVSYEQRRIKGIIPETFLSADDEDLRGVIEEVHARISTMKSTMNRDESDRLIQWITEKIAPWNSVGLMDKSKRNMYRHTAVEL